MRKNLTAYWGIELDRSAFAIQEISTHLESNTFLKPLEKIHSTLLYIGKKVDERDEIFREFEGKQCQLVIDAYGYSDDALALRVKTITCDNTIPSFATQQHVTIALINGVKPVDSVKTLLGDGIIVELDDVKLTGCIKRYL